MVDHETGRDGEPPGAVAIALCEIDPELEIDVAQVGRQREDEAICLGDLITRVAQYLERERLGLFGLAGRAGYLRRDDGERRAGGGDLGQGLLQSLQLCVAVRSPPTAIEGEHHRSAR